MQLTKKYLYSNIVLLKDIETSRAHMHVYDLYSNIVLLKVMDKSQT